MRADLYPMIFKRKSFHLFRNVGQEKISDEELEGIRKAYESFEALYPEIRTAIRIVSSEEKSFKRDAEYCIMIYSEKKDNYLLNAGYLGEQLDLYLCANNIGSLWYGLGKADEKSFDGLDYVIMIALRKVSDQSFYRKDMFKAKRKELSEVWSGETLGVAEIARFAPSAVNSQPWFVRNEEGKLRVFRYKKAGRIGLMPLSSVSYYNRIDMGIYLCILEICMAEKGIRYERTLFADKDDDQYCLNAEYVLQSSIEEQE